MAAETGKRNIELRQRSSDIGDSTAIQGHSQQTWHTVDIKAHIDKSLCRGHTDESTIVTTMNNDCCWWWCGCYDNPMERAMIRTSKPTRMMMQMAMQNFFYNSTNIVNIISISSFIFTFSQNVTNLSRCKIQSTATALAASRLSYDPNDYVVSTSFYNTFDIHTPKRACILF